MKVKLLTNLGTRDADRLGLDVKKCQAGAEVDVKGDALAVLKGNGWCEIVESVKAVASKAKIAKPKADDKSE